MSFASNRARALGAYLAAALGAMALVASGAQGNWLVLHPSSGKVGESDLTLKTASLTESNLLVPGKLLEILCSTLKAGFGGNALLLLEKSVTGHGAVEFTGCKTWQNHKEAPQCKPLEPIVAGGLGLIVLVGGVNQILLEPSPGAFVPFASIEYNPETCALPSENEVTGSLLVECGRVSQSVLLPSGIIHTVFSVLDCKNHQKLQLVRAVSPQSFGHGLSYGLNAATLDGIADVAIATPVLYTGEPFGGHI